MPVWIRGEVVGCKAWSSGHWYFSLRDHAAQIRCVVWARDQRGIPAPPDEGMQVVALGQLTVYAARGDHQLSVKAMEAQGHGLRAEQLAPLRRAELIPPLDGVASHQDRGLVRPITGQWHQRPQRGRLRLLVNVIHLVGDENHGLLRCAQHAHDVLVGRGGPDRGIHDEEHRIGEVGLERIDIGEVAIPAQCHPAAGSVAHGHYSR